MLDDELLEGLPLRARAAVAAELRSRRRPAPPSPGERAVERAERLEAEARRDAEGRQAGRSVTAGIADRRF